MKLFAWCDSPQAPTGFGRSAKHVLHALHETGQYEIVQLTVNQDPAVAHKLPWRYYLPLDRANDPYGLVLLREIVHRERPDLMWSTFDPEVPWKYGVPGTEQMGGGSPLTALQFLLHLRDANPGFRSLSWIPVDGGPLSDFELAALGMGQAHDFVATMSPHVHDLIAWTLKLKGYGTKREAVEERLKVIPHGIELERYAIPAREQRRAARQVLGLPPDAFIIAQVERNQQRKQNYLGMEVLETILAKRPKLRGKAMLYQHMVADEENEGCRLGFNLRELAWRYGLRADADVMWPRDFIPEERMPLVYQAADVFLSTSTGEGFQYPAWEALACGTPLVVPNNSARQAWFSDAPNVRLYGGPDRRLVMRGGYHRRMAMPEPREAADAILRLIDKPAKARARTAGREWLAKVADARDVQAAWVDAVAAEADRLRTQRREMRVVTDDLDASKATVVVMEHGPGLGDVIMAAPALVALRARLDGELHLRVPTDRFALAQMLGVADRYETKPELAGRREVRIDDLYRDGHRAGWGDPHTHRTDVIAQHLGVPLEELGSAVAQVDPRHSEQVRSKFTDAFGVDPASCVGIALESGNPHRALPKSYLPTLAGGVQALGLTPVALGRARLNVRRVGVVDLTGQTDLLYLIALIDQLGAVVSTDSAPLHIAGMLGTPLVGCFTLFDPDTRLRYYAGEKAAVTAEGMIEGQAFPAGPFPKAAPGAWAATIRPEKILAALRQLLGAEDAAPKIIRPGGVHGAL